MLGLSLSLGLTMSACAIAPDIGPFSPPQPPAELDFLTLALSVDARTREAMWQELAAADDPDEAVQLKRALMQSVPGHSGHDLKAAQSSLQALLNGTPPPGTTALIRARLAELRHLADCQAEARRLKQRLNQLVDIERDLKNGEHKP